MSTPALRELSRKRKLIPFVKAITSATNDKVDPPQTMLVAYVDSRAVEVILDEVVGPANWSFQLLSAPLMKQGNDWIAHGRLTIQIDGQAAYREDIGTGTETAEQGSKGASSDCFKRCAARFGVGRALYYLPKEWVDGKKNAKGKIFPTPAGEKQAIEKWKEILGRPDPDHAANGTASGAPPASPASSGNGTPSTPPASSTTAESPRDAAAADRSWEESRG